MLKINQVKCQIPHGDREMRKAICKKLGCKDEDILTIQILRRSLDARKKPQLFFLYTLICELKNENKILAKNQKNQDVALYTDTPYVFPAPKAPKQKVVVIGMGPAGLFCGLELAKVGYKPLVLERGAAVEERQADVDQFWSSGKLNTESNIQFGEGGAGTFSDGKLNTLVKDVSGRNRYVLQTFVEYGAPEEILYDHKPHLGTDLLQGIVKRMREDILQHGGEVRFHAKVTKFGIQVGKIHSVFVGDEEIPADAVVLAIGHSARDTFQVLCQAGISMEAKPFAVGYRVIHPQQFINQSQYGAPVVKELGAAAYKVTAKSESGRGVYSFCMCPGGYVVNASSEEGRLAVNGMSYHGRNSQSANSAIIVAVNPEDFQIPEAKEYPEALKGIAFQRKMEEAAFAAAKGKIPIQKYGDFRKEIVKHGMIKEFDETNSMEAFTPDLKGLYQEADLSPVLPLELQQSFISGMEDINRKIKGFASREVWLCGVESRTSSPIRIPREESGFANIEGLYPCGEGAGYAGGITSAAMDGVKIAQIIAEKDA